MGLVSTDVLQFLSVPNLEPIFREKHIDNYLSQVSVDLLHQRHFKSETKLEVSTEPSAELSLRAAPSEIASVVATNTHTHKPPSFPGIKSFADLSHANTASLSPAHPGNCLRGCEKYSVSVVFRRFQAVSSIFSEAVNILLLPCTTVGIYQTLHLERMIINLSRMPSPPPPPSLCAASKNKPLTLFRNARTPRGLPVGCTGWKTTNSRRFESSRGLWQPSVTVRLLLHCCAFHRCSASF